MSTKLIVRSHRKGTQSWKNWTYKTPNIQMRKWQLACQRTFHVNKQLTVGFGVISQTMSSPDSRKLHRCQFYLVRKKITVRHTCHGFEGTACITYNAKVSSPVKAHRTFHTEGRATTGFRRVAELIPNHLLIT